MKYKMNGFPQMGNGMETETEMKKKSNLKE